MHAIPMESLASAKEVAEILLGCLLLLALVRCLQEQCRPIALEASFSPEAVYWMMASTQPPRIGVDSSADDGQAPDCDQQQPWATLELADMLIPPAAIESQEAKKVELVQAIS